MFAITPPSVNQSRPSKSTISRTLSLVASLLAPPQCVLCDRAGLPGPLDLCASCLADMPRAAGNDLLSGTGFDLVCCPWDFEFPVDALVRALKFRGERCHARILGTLLARERLRHALPLPDRVIPVPLHPLRLRSRGYNQAAELARFAARELALACDSDALRRQRHTREQSGLRSAARAANVRDAFGATHSLQGLHVALVDDVITTGSTVAAAAAALTAAGAKAVELWVVARAVRRQPKGPRSSPSPA